MKTYSEEVCNLKHNRLDEKLEAIHNDLKEIKDALKDLNNFKFKTIGMTSVIVFILTVLSSLIEKLF